MSSDKSCSTCTHLSNLGLGSPAAGGSLPRVVFEVLPAGGAAPNSITLDGSMFPPGVQRLLTGHWPPQRVAPLPGGGGQVGGGAGGQSSSQLKPWEFNPGTQKWDDGSSPKKGTGPHRSIQIKKTGTCTVEVTKCWYIDEKKSASNNCTSKQMDQAAEHIKKAFKKWEKLLCPCVDESGDVVKDKEGNEKGCRITIKNKNPRNEREKKECMPVIIHCPESESGGAGPRRGWTAGNAKGETKPESMKIQDTGDDSSHGGTSVAIIEHELGHGLGIEGDNYDKATFEPLKGFEGTMMGDPNREHKVTREEACVIMRSLQGEGGTSHGNDEVCPEDQCCPGSGSDYGTPTATGTGEGNGDTVPPKLPGSSDTIPPKLGGTTPTTGGGGGSTTSEEDTAAVVENQVCSVGDCRDAASRNDYQWVTPGLVLVEEAYAADACECCEHER